MLVSFTFSVLRRFEDRGDLHLNVTEGSNIVLPCQPPYSRPKAKIMFKINGTSIIDHNTGKMFLKFSPKLNMLQKRIGPEEKNFSTNILLYYMKEKFLVKTLT